MRRLLFLLVVLAPSAAAQEGDWRTVEPALGAAVALGGGFGPEWEAEPSLDISAAVPAYGGHARLALRVGSYEAQAPGLPAFLAVAPSLGWGVGTGSGGLEVRAGPQVGVLHLRFEEAAGFGGNLQNETEVTVGAWAHVSLPVVRRLRLWAEADVRRVAFAEPATIAAASGGLAVRLGTPDWLQSLVR